MMMLKCICAATGAVGLGFSLPLFLLPAGWAYGLSGRRDTRTAQARKGTGEHEEANESFSINPHPWPQEEKEAAEKRANEQT